MNELSVVTSGMSILYHSEYFKVFSQNHNQMLHGRSIKLKI